jgi:transposase-like protein
LSFENIRSIVFRSGLYGGRNRSSAPVPIVSDGQTSIRKAVEKALPGVTRQLCHFHYLREAALPVYEADRHAKVQLERSL